MKQSRLDATLDALSDPTRRKVIDLLRDGPFRAGELAAALGMTPPALSRHLRILRESGLIQDERSEADARVRIFRLHREPFVVLRAWLDQVEAFWSDQLGSFKAHAEGKAKRRKRHMR